MRDEPFDGAQGRPRGAASAAPPEVVAGGGGHAYLIVAPALAAAIVLACSYRFSTLTSDDAFITFRYARNLAQGYGPVWNPGERVEGYTNFLWMLVMTGALRLGTDPVIASKLLGTLFTVLAILEVPRLLRLYPWTFPRSVPLALGLLSLGPWLPYWAVQGMETPLFMWLLTLGTRLALEDAERAPGPALAARAPLAFACLALTRPDGLLPAVAVAVVHGLARPARERRAFLLWFAAPFVLIYLPYFGWRYLYYGYLLPNTFYAKTGARLALVRRGVDYVGFGRVGFLRAVGPALLLFLGKPAYGAYLRRADRTILAILLSFVTYVAAVGGDYMPYHRFLTPLLPLFLVAVGDGLVGGFRFARKGWPRLPAAAAAFVYALLLATPALATLKEARKQHVYGGPFGAAEPDARFGSFLGRTAPSGASIATTIIGKIGYYSGLPVRDLLGLTEPAVAHRALTSVSPMAGHDKMDVGYALGRRPTFFYFRPIIPFEAPRGAARQTPTVTPIEKPKSLPEFREHEALFNRDYRAFRVDFGDLALDLYVRRDAPWPPASVLSPGRGTSPRPTSGAPGGV